MALRGDRPPVGLAWIVTWPLSAVLAAAVFLSAENLRNPLREPERPPRPLSTAEWNAQFPERVARLNSALRSGPLRKVAPLEQARGSGPLRFTHRLYEVQLPRAEQARAEALVEAARGVDPGLVISTVQTGDDTEVRFGLDGLLVTTVRFLWREHPEERPRAAVVIGPLGDDLRLARRVIELIDAPIALGVQPRLPFARQVAELGVMYEREVVVQYEAPPPPPPTPTLPPELIGFVTPPPAPRRPRSPDLAAGLDVLPEAVAVAWSGAGPTPPRADRTLLAAADQRALPFLGDRGDRKSAALPPPVVLVDAQERPGVLAEQLAAAAEAARKHGRTVVLARPTDATLTALQLVLPQWRAERIDLVPLSALVQASATPTPRPSRNVAGR